MMKIQKHRLLQTVCVKNRWVSNFLSRIGVLFIVALILSVSPLRAASLPEIEAIKQLYQNGQYNKVVRALGETGDWDATQSLYLGLSHLRLGNTLEAVKAWQSFVRLEKGSEGGRKISRYLSILLQKEAERLAKQRVAQEKSFTEKLDPKAVAIYPFANKGTASYAPLSRGLAAMIITDLSQVPGLTVVERIQIQAILDELKLAKSGLVNPESAPRVGKLVGAAKFTTGSFLDLAEEKIRLDATVTQTESGKRLSAIDSSGELASFYTIQKALVVKLLCSLGYCPESLDEPTRLLVEKIHTKNLKAFRHFSDGLVAFDARHYRDARRGFILALEEDPDFDLARKALLETPLLSLNVANIISGAEAIDQGGAFYFPLEPLVASVPVYRLPIPVTPDIFQQPTGTGGAATITVPVRVEVSFPD